MKLNNNKYQFLKENIRLDFVDCTVIPVVFEKFAYGDEDPKISVVFEYDHEQKSCYGIGYLSEQNKKIKNVFFSQKDRAQLMYTYDEDYSEHKLMIDDTCTKEVFSELLMVGFYSHASLQSTLLMHASAVAHEGQSIVFTAPSGTGKTTQAELWAKHKGATILNGDKVFLKKEDDGIHAWGSPWKGSSPYAENASAPLRAIVALEQAEENSIRKLEGFEVLEYVVPHVFFPSWDERCEQAVLTFLDQVLGETEVYLLKCRPDEAAVELLASTIKE